MRHESAYRPLGDEHLGELRIPRPNGERIAEVRPLADKEVYGYGIEVLNDTDAGAVHALTPPAGLGNNEPLVARPVPLNDRIEGERAVLQEPHNHRVQARLRNPYLTVFQEA